MSIEQVEKPAAVSAPNLRQRNAKIDALTGLSFIAACLVFMSGITYSAQFPDFVRSFIFSGSSGVTLFFVLSGFVLCYNYYDGFSTRFVATLKPFFILRFTQIYPLYLLMLLLFFAARPIPDELRYQSGLLLTQLTLTQAWSSDLGVVLSYNSPTWIFSVAVFLSVCFPLLILLIFKWVKKTWQLCLIGLVVFSASFALATWFSLDIISLINSVFFWVYTFPVARLGDFILGCVAARIYVLQMSKPVSRRGQTLGVTLLLLSIAAVIVLMGITANGTMAFLLPYKLDSGYSLFFVVIMYTLVRYTSPLSKFLSSKLLVHLGEASYAFYVLLLLFINRGLTVPFLSEKLGGDLYIVMQLLLLAVASLGAYTYVEKPLRKKLQQVFAAKAAAAEPSVPTAIGS